MTKLTYRGKNYTQNKISTEKQFLELTYRRNVYSNRRKDVSDNKHEVILNYRGVNYSI